MPVWFVLGVQSKARLMVVNCCGGVVLLKAAHCELNVDGTGCCVLCVPELAARCCHRKAPTTTIINSTGIPILKKRRVREFIEFLLFDKDPLFPNRVPSRHDTTAKRYAR